VPKIRGGEKMFNGAKYVTKGIVAEIGPVTQLMLWLMIDEVSVEKDYLQVFDLSKEGDMQKVIHTQEEPPYKRECLFRAEKVVDAKIFVIDDMTYCTMLLAEEY
jgi:hypothetical protein